MPNSIRIEIDQKTLEKLVVDYISEHTGQNLPADKVVIEVKSQQNYKSEWEKADFRATANVTL